MVVESSTIPSLTVNFVYDFAVDIDAYELFYGTVKEPLFRPSVVPDQERFIRFLQHTITLRRPDCPGCSIKINIVGKAKWTPYELLQASYDATTLDNAQSSPSPDQQHSEGSSSNPERPVLDATRVAFRLDAVNHAELGSVIIIWDDEGSSDEESSGEESSADEKEDES